MIKIKRVLAIPGASIDLIFTISAWPPTDLPIKLGLEGPVFVQSGMSWAARAAIYYAQVSRDPPERWCDLTMPVCAFPIIT